MFYQKVSLNCTKLILWPNGAPHQGEKSWPSKQPSPGFGEWVGKQKKAVHPGCKEQQVLAGAVASEPEKERKADRWDEGREQDAPCSWRGRQAGSRWAESEFHLPKYASDAGHWEAWAAAVGGALQLAVAK